METIVMLFPMIFTTNLVMSFVKLLAGASKNVVWLRGILAVCSIIGAVAAASLSGQPVDFNQLTDWGKLILESATLFMASHYSYRAIKEA